MNPSTVSATYVKSRVGERWPSATVVPCSACDTIVGMTARGDWRGPYVLNGRTVVSGSAKLCWKLSASLSAAIFVAEYGDCACSGCSSSIGT